MSFWDTVKSAASDAFDSKKGEIGDYLENVVTGTFAKVSEPARGNEVAAKVPVSGPAAPVATAVSSASEYMKWAIPAAVLVVIAVVLSRRKD